MSTRLETELSTEYINDILSDEMDGMRHYNMLENDDGSMSLEDVSGYEQEGTEFGAADINKTNAAVNALYEYEDITITPNTDYVSSEIVSSSRCRYFPALGIVIFRARFDRTATFSDSGWNIYTLGSISEKYPNIATPLSVYGDISSTTADLMAYINSSGNINLKMLAATNPSYFYLSGCWLLY